MDTVSQPEKSNSVPFEDGVVLGIDLGTSTSCVAVWHLDKNRVKIIKSKHNERTMPSVVRWENNPNTDPPISGKDALLNPSPSAHVIGCAKRVIGMNWDSETFSKIKSTLPFETSEGDDARVSVKVGDVCVSPVEVSQIIISEMREVAIEWMSRTGHRNFDNMRKLPRDESGKVVAKRCVIGVPVYFNEQQRVATKQAALAAGFTDHVTVLPESTAAALAYGLFIAGQKTVLVFDAGGGTTDVTLMEVDEGSFTTKSCGGDNMLGGEDMDTLLAQHLLKDHPSRDELVRDRSVRRKCAECRESLSSSQSAEVTLMPGEPTVMLTRQELEAVLQPFVVRARELVEKVCGGDRDSVGEVVLVGGVSRTPVLREMLKTVFPHLPDLCSSSDPATTVAEGLAIRGAADGGVKSKVFQSFLMSDVLPLAIGVEAFDSSDSPEEEGRMDVVLQRLAKLPAISSRVFRCADIGQKGITVDVFEGEHAVARKNDKVASFSFPLPPLEDTETDTLPTHRDVLVRFSMDEAGELRVLLVDDDYQESGDKKPVTTNNNEFYLQAAIGVLAVIYLLFRLLVRPHFEYHDFAKSGASTSDTDTAGASMGNEL